MEISWPSCPAKQSRASRICWPGGIGLRTKALKSFAGSLPQRRLVAGMTVFLRAFSCLKYTNAAPAECLAGRRWFALGPQILSGKVCKGSAKVR
jgi:hypothetical protein